MDNNLTSLPKDLKIGGYLCLMRNKLTFLPEDLKVGGGSTCIRQ